MSYEEKRKKGENKITMCCVFVVHVGEAGMSSVPR